MTAFKPLIAAALSAGFAIWTFIAPTTARAAEALYDPPVGSRWAIHAQAREDDERAGAIRTTVITRDAEFSVGEKTAQGFRISYVLRDFDVQGDTAQARLASVALRAMRGVVIQATIDASGKPVRVENFAETQAAFAEAMDGALATLSVTPDVAAKLRSLIEAMAPRDADKAAEWYVDDLPLLAVAQNTHLSLGEVRDDSELSPNPFGGAPLKTNTTLRVIDVDNDSGARRLVRTRAFDEAAMRSFILDTLARLGQAGDADKMQKALGQMSLSNDGQTEFSVEGGMTRAVNEDTLITIKAMGQTATKHQQTTIAVTPAP